MWKELLEEEHVYKRSRDERRYNPSYMVEKAGDALVRFWLEAPVPARVYDMQLLGCCRCTKHETQAVKIYSLARVEQAEELHRRANRQKQTDISRLPCKYYSYQLGKLAVKHMRAYACFRQY